MLDSVGFDDLFAITVSVGNPNWKLPGLMTRKLVAFQFVERDGWRFMVAGNLYIDGAQGDDGTWEWTPRHHHQQANHGRWLCLYQDPNNESLMTDDQNENIWTAFQDLIARFPSCSFVARLVARQQSYGLLNEHPEEYHFDLRIPTLLDPPPHSDDVDH